MHTEYDSDDFDMEQVSGTDNPTEPGADYDESLDHTPGVCASNQPKHYIMQTRYKTIDEKTGELVYRVVRQPSNETRKLIKPFSYKRK